MNSPSFVGHVDAIENREIYGWALNVLNPGQPVIISVFIDGVLAVEALAGYYRPDVAQALECSGRNGFYVEVDSICQDKASASIEVRYPDGSPIEGSPILHKPSGVPPPPERPTLLFLHIPKTAGTAFREVVMPNYRQSEVMYIYGDPPGFPSTCLRDIPLSQRARLRLVFGHYGYGVHCDMPNPCDYAALLRDPLLRIWSHYTHLVRDGDPSAVRHGKPIPIEEVLASKLSVHLDNLYVRYFCGIEECEIPAGTINRDLYERASTNARQPNVFLGHQSDLPAAYSALVRELGWIAGLECPRMNESPDPARLPNASQERAIRHFNAWDFKLYRDIWPAAI
jgi:hypothetical protein